MTTEQIESCVTQLTIGSNRTIGWISDGSFSKLYYGICQGITATTRGLRIKVKQDSGRYANVNWRMSLSLAEQIRDSFYNLQRMALI